MTRQLVVRFDGEAGSAGEALAEGFDSALQNTNGKRPRRIRIELGSPPVQRRTLRNLPPVSLGRLRELLQHQARRFFHPVGDGLTVDIGRRARGKDGAVTALAVETRLVDQLLVLAEERALSVVDIVPHLAGVPSGFTLLPQHERRRRLRAAWRKTKWTAVLTVGVAAGLAAFVVGYRMKVAARVADELERLRGPAAGVAEARRNIADAARMVEAIADGRARSGDLRNLLDRVAETLPDSASLTGLTMSRRGLGRLDGATQSPLQVLARFQRVHELGPPALVGSTGGDNRFTISFGRDSQ